ncbi:MAG: PilT/PilU family type 4a pilus ATPase [Sulfuritalea sp.]|jgi:twitching motility protein PilU|nr:PilT/PilU family type 4a pilus ATPase [Sulfuritalea sp.]
MSNDNPIEVIHHMLQTMVSRKASDLFISVGFPPALKIDGKLTPISDQVLTEMHTRTFARAVMNDKQIAAFEATKECNFAIAPAGIGRFRASVYVDQNGVGLVMRTINTKIPTMEELGLPPILRDVAMSERGLVMVVGGTGSGKSTSLAAMIGYRNENSHGHIITIEDPVEFVHEHRNCIVTQREVGVTTESWEVALKNTLRQAPDVILIGEIRDRETMEHAIAFAETGHLCLATLHANSTNQALDRIINLFPDERRQQLLMDLSLNVRAFLSQRLVPREDGRGRVAAFEIMLDSPLIKDHIFKGEVHEIKELMARSVELGMQTFDKALFDLYQANVVSYEDALRFADSHNDVRLRIKLNPGGRQPKDLGDKTDMDIV